ncbi:alpha/beta hydrolase [Paenibacillus whitsoniae]|uniref:Alpha/beta hydrolase n=1 Tax=Paenibacillus whitsoniae TaxID=2496558 RepID=A0A3S0A1I6_9BACL|nr:alpha/beta hydrolase-fold protein [Paenibacillus whitsoniae]RTE06432.1 alpha/beta hydrolase [Paenibacillus whitsoniae]
MTYPISAQTASEGAARDAFYMPNTEQFLLHTPVRERPYHIYVARPMQEAPPEGFPVIYLLDGNATFATTVETIRVQSRVPDKTGVHPAVIVGIGYPTNQPFDSTRFYDFTMPTPQEVLDALPVRNKEQPRPEVGGADALRTLIEETLKPRIERDYPINRSRQAIFGHSLGGLFVLQTLFTRPESFQTYIAGSPSVHWNKALLQEQEEKFQASLPNLHTPLTLFMTFAELERNHPSNMSENTTELYDQLSQIPAEKLRVKLHEFEGEGHITVLPALISRMLRLV